MYKRTDKKEYFPTPQNIVDKLWSFFPEELLGKEITVFDSCAGTGSLCHPSTLPTKINFIKWDIDPKAEDVEKHDFFTDNLPTCDLSVCNPPFGLKKEWIERLFTVSPYILLICPKSAFKQNWDAVIASGKDPNFELENMTSFKGITTPIMIGLLKRTDGSMPNKERTRLYKDFIDGLIERDCNLDYWRRMFDLQRQHLDYSWEKLNEIY